MRVVIEADEQYKAMLQEIANAIKAKISFKEDDFFHDLPEHVIRGVEESREQIKRGEFSSHEEVMKKMNEKYK